MRIFQKLVMPGGEWSCWPQCWSRRSFPRPSRCRASDIESGLRRNPGIVATANHCVNSIPAVCAAEPGIRTCLELPLITGRADPALRRQSNA